MNSERYAFSEFYEWALNEWICKPPREFAGTKVAHDEVVKVEVVYRLATILRLLTDPNVDKYY